MNSHDLSSLRTAARGAVLGPSDAGFESAHTGFNLAERHAPDVVVCAEDAADVGVAVRCAADHGLPVRVQATGHSMGIPMDGGVLVNTAAMTALTLDPASRSVRVAAGTRWSAVLAAAAPHGLAPLCGSSPTVGVVGYTLGGGMGPMARTYGFASDHVRSLQLTDVTGRAITVDAEREPDLFWALRGGKPALGVVTELEIGLMEQPTYYGGSIFYPGESADTVLRCWAAWTATVPDAVTTSIALLRLPDVPQVPEPLRGRLSVQLRYVHTGSQADAEEVLAPMRAVVAPVVDLVGPSPIDAIPSVHQDPTDPMPARDEGMLLGALPSEAIDALLAAAGPDAEVPLIIVELRLMGGALAADSQHDSAVGGRTGAFNLCVIGPYPPPLRDAVDAASEAVLDAVRPWAADESLVNFLGYATAPERVRAAWRPEVRERLDTVQQAWDPDGVFRFSHPVG